MHEPGVNRLRARLGYAGLIPFVVLSLASLFDVDPPTHDLVLEALAGYSALIVSFLGAVHWGLDLGHAAANRRTALVWGVVPALLAWPLLLVDPPASLAGLAILLVVIWFVDARLIEDPRYLALRLRLTTVAVISLAVGIYSSLTGAAP